jgi:hypothetical protein
MCWSYSSLTDFSGGATQKLPIWSWYYLRAQTYDDYIRHYRHTCWLKHNPLDDDSAVIACSDCWFLRHVQCASDCEREEVWYVHLTTTLFELRSLLNYCLYNIPRYSISIGWLLKLCGHSSKNIWRILRTGQWRTEGGGVQIPPKFRSFAKSEPNSQFRGIYIRNNLLRI